jgi:hypothetical protein
MAGHFLWQLRKQQTFSDFFRWRGILPPCTYTRCTSFENPNQLARTHLLGFLSMILVNAGKEMFRENSEGTTQGFMQLHRQQQPQSSKVKICESMLHSN